MANDDHIAQLEKGVAAGRTDKASIKRNPPGRRSAAKLLTRDEAPADRGEYCLVATYWGLDTATYERIINSGSPECSFSEDEKEIFAATGIKKRVWTCHSSSSRKPANGTG
jgi:hypothetical protein